MTRSLSAGMQAAVAAERGVLVHFLEINSSGGVLRLTTAPQDIAWNGFTWSGIGGSVRFGTPQEGPDLRGQAVEITLDGVDQTFLGSVLNNHMRGRELVIHYAHLDQALGTVIATPLEIFRGFINESIQVTEQKSPDLIASGTVEVKTRAVSRLADFQRTIAVRSNVHSHRDMLRRAGLSGNALLDLFFRFVPELVNRPIYWGTEAPARSSRDGSRQGPSPDGSETSN